MTTEDDSFIRVVVIRNVDFYMSFHSSLFYHLYRYIIDMLYTNFFFCIVQVVICFPLPIRFLQVFNYASGSRFKKNKFHIWTLMFVFDHPSSSGTQHLHKLLVKNESSTAPKQYYTLVVEVENHVIGPCTQVEPIKGALTCVNLFPHLLCSGMYCRQ